LWLNLEARYDHETERDRLGARLTSDVKIFAGPVQYWRGH
jgi:hypothetical protein